MDRQPYGLARFSGRGLVGVNTIWKYPLSPETIVSMPIGAVPLTVQMQAGRPTMWALVNPDVQCQDRVFKVLGTGHDGDVDAKDYIGTWQDGSLVFHLFEMKKKEIV
jgi:hypothetical protein